MTNELPPRTPLEAHSTFSCERCDYEIGVGEKYVRYNNKTKLGHSFEFVCLRCAKEQDGNRIMVNL